MENSCVRDSKKGRSEDDLIIIKPVEHEVG